MEKEIIWRFISFCVFWQAPFFICCSTALLIWFVIPNLSTMTLILGAVLGILGYIVYLYIYLRLMYQKAQKRYREGRQKIKKLAAEYRVLEEMYQQEEETETPEGWK